MGMVEMTVTCAAGTLTGISSLLSAMNFDAFRVFPSLQNEDVIHGILSILCGNFISAGSLFVVTKRSVV